MLVWEKQALFNTKKQQFILWMFLSFQCVQVKQ